MAPRFGPWMAAIRHRIPPSGTATGAQHPPSSSTARGPSPSQAMDDGWLTPGKTSRRRAVPSAAARNVAVVDLDSPASNVLPAAVPRPCQSVHSVPVTVALSKSSSRKKSSKGKAAVKLSKSAFPSSLSSHDSVQNVTFNFTASASEQGMKILSQGNGLPKARDDSNPASLKRARSVDSGGPTTVSLLVKEKGQGVGGNLTTSLQGISRGHHQQPANSCDHETAVTRLKEAILPSSSSHRDLDGPTSDSGGADQMIMSQQSALTDQGAMTVDSSDAGALLPLAGPHDMDPTGCQVGTQSNPLM